MKTYVHCRQAGYTASESHRNAKICKAFEALHRPTDEKIAKELKDYGAWDDEELQDTAQNWRRLVWCAAHNITEEENPDCFAPC